jgi:cell division septal protein FtsQ
LLRRKSRNRRFQRYHVLDVKLRSSERRRIRLRALGVALAIACAVFAALFFFWRGGDWVLRQLIYENPAFAVHHLDVRTDGVIALEQLRRWAGVKYDDNLLALDLARVRRDLELIPAIHAASVERVLPHTLRIRVSEREPIAQCSAPVPGTTNGEVAVFLLDAEGFVAIPLRPEQRSTPAQTNDHLPTLVGVPLRELRAGRVIESAQIRAALRLIDCFERSPMAGVVDVKQIDVGLPGMLPVVTEQSSEVVFGLGDFEAQLRRWFVVYEYGRKIAKHLAWLDLSVANNVPARWLEASLVPPLPPKSSKSARVRRKNV